ncbi:MAG: hypothetical protein J5973_05670 [Eubacterium sp.]|nr:hypothetical protein [Eubacterium sp.]
MVKVAAILTSIVLSTNSMFAIGYSSFFQIPSLGISVRVQQCNDPFSVSEESQGLIDKPNLAIISEVGDKIIVGDHKAQGFGKLESLKDSQQDFSNNIECSISDASLNDHTYKYKESIICKYYSGSWYCADTNTTYDFGNTSQLIDSDMIPVCYCNEKYDFDLGVVTCFNDSGTEILFTMWDEKK